MSERINTQNILLTNLALTIDILAAKHRIIFSYFINETKKKLIAKTKQMKLLAKRDEKKT